MEQLQQLHVPHIATDQLIAAVGRSCHRLQLLDLTGAIGLTEAGIKVEKVLILIDSTLCLHVVEKPAETLRLASAS